MATSRLLISSRSVCARCVNRISQQRNHYATDSLQSTEESKLPRVTNPSFWSSLVPRPFRRAEDPVAAAERARRREAGSGERRVGVIFLVLGIIVGSNAIQIISIRRHMLDYSRKTDAKLELLREVVKRVKNGENIDVKKILGTGDPDHEKEWEEVVKELESHELSRKHTEKRRAQHEARQNGQDSTNETEDRSVPEHSDNAQAGEAGPSTGRKTKFLM